MERQEIRIVGEGKGRMSLCVAKRALCTTSTPALPCMIFVSLALLDSSLLEISPSIKEECTTDHPLSVCSWLIAECIFSFGPPTRPGIEDSIVANCFLLVVASQRQMLLHRGLLFCIDLQGSGHLSISKIAAWGLPGRTTLGWIASSKSADR
jgi:hypothetical protein